MKPTNSPKHRVNITIDRDLHAQAGEHARSVHHTDFSGLVTKLLVDDLGPEANAARGKRTLRTLADMRNTQVAAPAEPMPTAKRRANSA